ncbi:hypothetical protein [Nostoc sp.]|uniref:hypothetical protein n=1 Tax=Nostoc sp. TaxID=1180 RepID=UPI002FF4FE05
MGKTGKQVTGVTAKREAVLSLPLYAYQKWKQPLTQGYWKAAKFLRQESFFSTNDLPYRTQLVPLAVVMAFLSDRWLEPKIHDKIARWFWCGILGELYGGAVETRMTLDIQELIDWIENGKEEPATVRDANFQPARLGTLRSRTSSLPTQRCACEGWGKGKGKRVRNLKPFPLPLIPRGGPTFPLTQ